MPRPQNKADLIKSANENFEKMRNLIDTLPDPEHKTFSFEDRDKNVRDILIHLYERQILMIRFVQENTKWNNMPFLPEPYNWKTYPQMNIELWEKNQNTAYDAAVKNLKDSHKKILDLIQWFNDEELFVKKYFSWTWTTNLWSYFISTTSSHYDWAIKKLKKHKNNL